MADAPPPVSPAWKTDGPALPGKSRRVVLLGVLLALVAVAGAIVGVLYWLSPPIEPDVLPLTIVTEPTGGPAGGLEEDRLALSEGGWLGRPLDDWSANPHRDQIRLRFRALTRAPRSRPVVAYLASPAAVDEAGGVFLLPADQLGDHPRNRLTLTELLVAFADCPARHRLLILNLIPPTEDPRFAAPPGDLSTAVLKALELTPDPDRLCLVACGPGQAPIASAELGRTVFGWYLEAGLRGEADGWAGDSPDGRVTVNELAAFLRGRASRWVTTTRGATQTPLLVGSAADFTLRASSRTELVDGKSVAEITYPDWLRAGWEQLERWRADGRAGAAPWAFRKLRTALLAAERDLLGGKPAATVQRDLDRWLTTADQLAATLMATPTPDPIPMLAAIYPNYALPDPTLFTELRDAARRLDSRPPAPPLAPGEKPTPEPVVPPEFDGFKAKPHPALAVAAFLVLAEDPAPTVLRIRGLAQLLAFQSPTPRFAETALIARLAALAAQAPTVAWSAERAALTLQTARLLEAATQPSTFAWASSAIDRVYRLRADAEATYFAPGYASSTEAHHRLQEAVSAARKLKETADRLHAAMTTWDEATEWLTGATVMVQAGGVPLPVAEQLATAARKLGDDLQPPPAPLDLAAFMDRATVWDQDVAAVRTALAEFTQPFRSEALTKLRVRAEAPDAGPAGVAELDGLLAMPLLPTAERANLWNVRAAIARRLATEALRQDSMDREAIRKGLASPPQVNPREIANVPGVDLEANRRRARWTIALLKVGGLEEPAITPIEDDLNRLAGDRFAFADRLRRVWLEEAPGRLTPTGYRSARLARVLPVIAATERLDSPLTNPDSQTRRSTTRATWAWQAARFEYESHELLGEDGAFSFTVSAARACRTASGLASETYLEVTPGAIPRLTPEQQTTSLQLKFRVVGKQSREAVKVEVLTPAEGWVTVGGPTSVTLDPLREGSTELPLAAGASPTAFPGARGVMVEAKVGERNYHRRVPVLLDAITDRLTLLIRTAAGQPPSAAGTIRVRPNSTVQPYQLLLANPTPKERKVIVRLAGLNRETEVVTIAPGKTSTLVFPAPPTVPPPPGQVTQTPAPDEGLILKGDELVLNLFDPTDREVIRQTIRVPVTVANPIDYLRVTNPTFQPAAGARSNRLSVTIVPGDVPPGGPCQVRLGFPPERNPGLVVRDGSLTGNVSAGGSPLTLYADNLALPGQAGADVWVTVSADGVERIVSYFASLPSLGETVRLTPVGTPLVRVKVEPVATGTAPLPVTLEVDNAPPGATLEFLIGTAKDDFSPVVADLRQSLPAAKNVAGRVKFDPKGETLLLSGTIKDYEPKLPIELLVGRRVLEARLLDRTGQELATHRAKVTFDGTPPQNVQFIDLPVKARKDQPLSVRATCEPTVSGIKEVKFFLGRPQNNAPPQNPPPVAGKLFDEKTNEWRGVIPVEGQKGIVTVGVQFTTNAGLSKIETQDVELVDPAELNKPEPGKIAGKLVENQLPQPGAVVFLYDDKGNAKAKTTTKPDGTFEFKDLLPATYYLFSEKESTNRQVKQEVAVKAGETLPVTLELLLK